MYVRMYLKDVLYTISTMNTGSAGREGRRVKPWIYLLDSKGMIVDQVQVSWPSVRKVYYEAKEKARKV